MAKTIFFQIVFFLIVMTKIPDKTTQGRKDLSGLTVSGPVLWRRPSRQQEVEAENKAHTQVGSLV